MFLYACTSGFFLAKGTGTERTGNKFLLLFYATKDMHNGGKQLLTRALYCQCVEAIALALF